MTSSAQLPLHVLRGATTLDGRRIDVRVALTPASPHVGASSDLDASDLLVAPGFIDLQVNGAGGADITSDPASMWAVGHAIARTGVTAFLPTVVTSAPDTVAHAQAVLRAGPPAGYAGATAVGLHVEGPFLSPARRGVHDPALLRLPDEAVAGGWSAATGVRLVTLAPELPGALALIRSLVARGVVVSIGHSAATYDEAMAAIEAGARYATHVFNGMAPLEHRTPGIVGAVLRDPRVTVGLIADGVHVHPAVVDLVWRIVGPGRLSAVTDAVASLGVAVNVADGRAPARLGDAAIDVSAGAARAGDRLAGGVTPLDAVVRNLVAFCGATPADAIGTVTSVPARVLGLADRVAGGDPVAAAADATLLTRDLHVAGTIIGGRLVWWEPGVVR